MEWIYDKCRKEVADLHSKIRKFAIWIFMGITAAAAFILALNITTDSLNADDSKTNMRIDLDKSPEDITDEEH